MIAQMNLTHTCCLGMLKLRVSINELDKPPSETSYLLHHAAYIESSITVSH